MKDNNKTNILNFIIALLGVLAPGAYLIGLSFYQGGLSAYGVDPANFPSSAPDVYVSAYYAIGYFLLAIGEIVNNLFNNIFKAPVIYYILIIIIFLTMILYCFLKHHENVKNSRYWFFLSSVISYFHWKNNNFTKSLGIIGVASYGFLAFLAIIGMIAVFWWFAPYAAYHNAQRSEQKNIDMFLENGCYENNISNWNNCVSILDNNNVEVAKGILIALNANGVAIFKEDGSYFYNIQSEYKIVHYYKNKTQDNKK